LLGIALGGFWTMSGAVAMRLVPEDQVPRALSLIFSAVSVATVVAAPLGSYLGATIGWRAVFLLTSIIGAAALAMQFATLPRMAPSGLTSLRTLTGLLARPGILRGLIAVVAIFTGHFALFTFVRPFLEAGSGDNVDWISALLLGFGVANFIGTLIAGRLIGRNLRLVLGTMPLVIGASALGLVAVEGQALSTLLLIAIWGMSFGAVPVAWMTWC
ncbi:MFS transporter, partial [Thioclava sp. BHET1]